MGRKRQNKSSAKGTAQDPVEIVQGASQPQKRKIVRKSAPQKPTPKKVEEEKVLSRNAEVRAFQECLGLRRFHNVYFRCSSTIRKKCSHGQCKSDVESAAGVYYCRFNHQYQIDASLIRQKFMNKMCWLFLESVNVLKTNLPCCPLYSKKNNVQEELIKTGTVPLVFPLWSRYAPLALQLNLPYFDGKTNRAIRMILQHEYNLPVFVKEAFRDGESIGRGMFTTQSIPEAHLVYGYVGVITPDFVCPKNDSLFTVGYCSDINNIRGTGYQLFIDPVKKGNGARFINASYEGQPGNLQPILGLFAHYNQDFTNFKIYPIILLFSTRPIQAGQELIYSYGTGYAFERKLRDMRKRRQMNVSEALQVTFKPALPEPYIPDHIPHQHIEPLKYVDMFFGEISQVQNEVLFHQQAQLLQLAMEKDPQIYQFKCKQLVEQNQAPEMSPLVVNVESVFEIPAEEVFESQVEQVPEVHQIVGGGRIRANQAEYEEFQQKARQLLSRHLNEESQE